ncbi:MAG: hypothetical protein ACI8ZM_000141 [Crocinitomix sp.]
MKLFKFIIVFACFNVFSQYDVPEVDDYYEDEKFWVGPVDTLHSILPNQHLKLERSLIPFRIDTLWGLADENGKIIVQPAYDGVRLISSSPFEHEASFSCREQGIHLKGKGIKTKFYSSELNDKYGVFTEEKTIVPPLYYGIRIIHNGFFYTGRRAGDLYNLKGEILLKGVYEFELLQTSMFADKNQFVFGVSSEEKNGFILYDYTEQKIIKWLYTCKNGLEVLLCEKELRCFIWKDDGNHIAYYKVIPNNIDRTIQLEGIPTEIMDNEYIDLHNGPNYKTGSEIEKLESLERKKHSVAATYYSSFLKNQQFYFIQKSVGYNYQQTPKIDTIPLKKSLQNIIIRTQKHGSWYSTMPYQKDNFTEIDTIFYYKNFATYTQKNKQGVLIGNSIIPAKYDSIGLIKIKGHKPHFLVSKTDKKGGMKWGTINNSGAEIIPIKYDAIYIKKRAKTTYGMSSVWIIQIDDKKGLVSASGEIIVPVECEEIEQYKTSSAFTIYKDGKYGAYHTKELIAPKFECRISPFRKMEINGKQFYMAIDEDGNELGYINENGVRFFK